MPGELIIGISFGTTIQIADEDLSTRRCLVQKYHKPSMSAQPGIES